MSSSIISRNIQRLGQKFLEKVNYVDIDYRGFLDDNAFPTITAGNVLVNNLKLWLMSTKGDYYRRYSMGGFFDDIHKYSMSDDGAAVLTNDLRSAILANFTNIEIINLSVTPDLMQRFWRVQIIARDTITGILATLSTEVE